MGYSNLKYSSMNLERCTTSRLFAASVLYLIVGFSWAWGVQAFQIYNSEASSSFHQSSWNLAWSLQLCRCFASCATRWTCNDAFINTATQRAQETHGHRRRAAVARQRAAGSQTPARARVTHSDSISRVKNEVSCSHNSDMLRGP